jgi:hypothetical protein
MKNIKSKSSLVTLKDTSKPGIPTDARPELLLTEKRGRMEINTTLGIGPTGAHPKMYVRFGRNVCTMPTASVVFYQQ